MKKQRDPHQGHCHTLEYYLMPGPPQRNPVMATLYHAAPRYRQLRRAFGGDAVPLLSHLAELSGNQVVYGVDLDALDESQRRNLTAIKKALPLRAEELVVEYHSAIWKPAPLEADMLGPERRAEAVADILATIALRLIRQERAEQTANQVEQTPNQDEKTANQAAARQEDDPPPTQKAQPKSSRPRCPECGAKMRVYRISGKASQSGAIPAGTSQTKAALAEANQAARTAQPRLWVCPVSEAEDTGEIAGQGRLIRAATATHPYLRFWTDSSLAETASDVPESDRSA